MLSFVCRLLANAAQVLSDPAKRRAYDSGGERALQQVGEGKGPSSLLVLCNLDCIVFCSTSRSSMLMKRSHVSATDQLTLSFLQEQQRPVSKASTAQARVSITLQEGAVTSVRRAHLSQLAATSHCSHITIFTLSPAFSGGSKTLSFQRSRPCVTCSGKGLIRDGPDCMRCNGNGVTVATVCAFYDFVVSMPDLNRLHVTSRAAQVQVMMGLHQQVQMKCAACAGTGAEGCRVQKHIRQPEIFFLFVF